MWNHRGFEGLVIIPALVVPDLKEILSRLLIFMCLQLLPGLQHWITSRPRFAAVDALSTFLVLYGNPHADLFQIHYWHLLRKNWSEGQRDGAASKGSCHQM